MSLESVWFYQDGDRRAIATNATNKFDFEWSAVLELAVMAAALPTREEQSALMAAWIPLVGELATRLRHGRATRLLLRAGCESLTHEHLIHGGEVQ